MGLGQCPPHLLGCSALPPLPIVIQGLGKTFQTISLLAYLKFTRGLCGPHLVVAPKSVVPNWVREVKKWCPGLRVLKFHGDKEERVRLKQEELFSAQYDVIVTTYEMVSKVDLCSVMS